MRTSKQAAVLHAQIRRLRSLALYRYSSQCSRVLLLESILGLEVIMERALRVDNGANAPLAAHSRRDGMALKISLQVDGLPS